MKETMQQIKEQVQPLYDAGDLLGFSVCGNAGEIAHNESFFSDEVAWQATAPFVSAARQLEQLGRTVQRLTVELDEVVLVYGKLEQGHALFTLDRRCDLDAAAVMLS